MVAQISFKEGFQKRNPDVLTCIANLSNDEVFTPPSIANQMLDTLTQGWANANSGEDIWTRSDLKFLDPFTKSGVFLREIVKRLNAGLEPQFPNLQNRIDHILVNQVYGIGITSLTTLLARRSLYCSKWANGKHSIATSFAKSDGNVWFEPTEHTWVGGRELIEIADEDGNPSIDYIDGKCKFCGANKKVLGRGIDLETHAYSLIHSDNPVSVVERAFGEAMQFDVIIGNPPYQLNDGGGGKGSSASPLYNLFVEQALKLKPRSLCMVIPARWFSGGKGLDNFRDMMLASRNISNLVYFPDSAEVFPGPDFGGGVCYFLHDENYSGKCEFKTIQNQKVTSTVQRYLNEDGKVLVGMTEARPVLEKIRKKGFESFDTKVSSRKPFGFSTAKGSTTKPKSGSHLLCLTSEGNIWISKDLVTANLEIVDSYKVVIGKAYGERGAYPYKVLAKPKILEPGMVCTETYLVCGSSASKKEMENLAKYIETRFFRFLLLIQKNTQNITREKFSFIPVLPMDEIWTDEKLFNKFKISHREQEYIKSIIKLIEE